MTKKIHHRLTMGKRREMHGYVFILPWILGVIAFFIKPLAEACIYLFNSVKIESGYVTTTYVGLSNFRKVFFEDPENTRLIVSSLGNTFFECLLIVVFSLLISIALNSKLPTVSVAKAIYALPIIVSSGVLLMVFKNDLFAQSALQNSDATIFQATALRETLTGFGLDYEQVNFMTQTVDKIMDIVWRTGIQILIFIGGLNSVSPQLYEVCKVEGATAWQTFWEVTFPMVTPYILLNTIYTVVDSFMYVENPVMQKIQTYFESMQYESSTVLGICYCFCVLILAGIVMLIISKRVFYIEN